VKFLLRLWESPTLTTWFSIATRSLGLVVVLPLVLRRFSAPEIVLWQVFSTIIGFQLLVDVGFNTNFARLLAYAMGGAHELPPGGILQRAALPAGATPNGPLLRRVADTMFGVYDRLALLLGALLALGGTVTVIHPIAQLAAPVTGVAGAGTTSTQGWLAWVLLMGSTSWLFRNNAQIAFLQGVGCIAPLRRTEAAVGAATACGNIAVLAAGGNVLALVLSNQCWLLVSWLACRHLVRGWCRGAGVPFPRAAWEPEVLRSVWPGAWRAAIGAVMSYGTLQGANLFYSQGRNSTAIASFLVGSRIMFTLGQLANAPFYSRLPHLARHLVQHNLPAIRAGAGRGISLGLLTLAVPTAVLAFAGPAALRFLGSQTAFPAVGLWLLLGAAMFTERLGAMLIQLYSLSGDIRWHWANGITGALFIIGVVWGFESLGEKAIPTAALMSNVVFLLPYAVYLNVCGFAAIAPTASKA
jgi:hypothetical protein